MKKVVLIFAVLFTFSSSLISCRENPNEETDVELNNDELDIDDDATTGEDTINQVPRTQGVGEIDDVN